MNKKKMFGFVSTLVSSAVLTAPGALAGGSAGNPGAAQPFLDIIYRVLSPSIINVLCNLASGSLESITQEEASSGQNHDLQRAIIKSLSNCIIKLEYDPEFTAVMSSVRYSELQKDKISKILRPWREEYNKKEFTTGELDKFLEDIDIPLYSFSTLEPDELRKYIIQILLKHVEDEEGLKGIINSFGNLLTIKFKAEFLEILKENKKAGIAFFHSLVVDIYGKLQDLDTKIEGLSEQQEMQFDNIERILKDNCSMILKNTAKTSVELEQLTAVIARMQSMLDAYFTRDQNIIDLKSKLFINSGKLFKRLHEKGMMFHRLTVSQDIIPSYDLDEGGAGTDTKKNTSITGCIRKLQHEEMMHAVIAGEGGKGKTTSMLKVWEDFLGGEESGPVPLYISLSDYNAYYTDNGLEKHGSADFIISSIAKTYMGVDVLSEQDLNALWLLFGDGSSSDKHEIDVLLILDGFNEVTVKNDLLLSEIKQFIVRGINAQIVITSRYDMRNIRTYMADFHKMSLLELTDSQINCYLDKMSVEHPDKKVMQLVKNPMMLTIYADSCHKLNKPYSNRIFIKAPVETSGELMWNYLESLLINTADDDTGHLKYSFMLRHVLPYIGYKMESLGRFALTEDELMDAVNEAHEDADSDDFIMAFRMYSTSQAAEILIVGDSSNKRKIFDRLKNFLEIVKDLNLINYDREYYYFIHQNYRDFFAAYHILNQIRMSSSVPEALKQKPLSIYVRQYMGEIEGEHFNRPRLDKENKLWSVKHYKEYNDDESLIIKALNGCRNVFDGRNGYAVWNLFEILKSSRRELTGSDLSQLDLRNISLNGCRFYRKYGNFILCTKFDGALIQAGGLISSGHRHGVNEIAYSPDSSRIMSASSDSTVKEWDTRTGEYIRTYSGNGGAVHDIAYHPSGRKIVTGCFDKNITDKYTVKEWDTETGQCIKGYDAGSLVLSAAYTSDGNRILSGSSNGIVREWDPDTGECINAIKVYESHGTVQAACSPDNTQIAAWWGDNSIRIWDIKTGACIRVLEGHTGTVHDAAYSPDGRRLVTASADKTIREWDAETGKCIRTYDGHSGDVYSVVYNLKCNRILSASKDKTVKEWDNETGECIHTYEGHKQMAVSAIYSPDGKRIASASMDRSVKEWDIETGECLHTYEGNYNNILNAIYEKGGRRIAFSTWDSMINEVDYEKGDPISILEGHRTGITELAYSADGKRIFSSSADKSIKEWDLETEECIKTYYGHNGAVNSICCSPDGKNMVSASQDRTVRVWDIETGECAAIHGENGCRVKEIIYSPDRKRLLLLLDDGHINERDDASWSLLHSYGGKSEDIDSIAYSPDGRRIVYIDSVSQSVKELDVDTGSCIRSYKNGQSIRSVRYRNDGRRIAAGSFLHEIKEWDTKTGKCVKIYKGYIGHINGIFYSPNGKRIISASWHGNIKRWDTESGACIFTKENYSGLLLQGCSFMHIHPESSITDEEKQIFRSYGAEI